MDQFLTITKLSVNRRASPRIPVGPGDRIMVLGRSGTGKTSFCLGIQGLVNGFTVVQKRDLIFAYLPTDPTMVFSGIKGTVRGEIELTFQFRGVEVGDIGKLAEAFGVRELLERDPFTLSGGEAMQAALCIVSALRPDIWILDQAYDWLFPSLREQVWSQLREWAGPDSAVIENLFALAGLERGLHPTNTPREGGRGPTGSARCSRPPRPFPGDTSVRAYTLKISLVERQTSGA